MASEVYGIIQEISSKQTIKEKLETLEKYSDMLLFKRVLKMTYDTTEFKFYVNPSAFDIIAYPFVKHSKKEFIEILDLVESDLCSGLYNNRGAIHRLESLFGYIDGEDRFVVSKMVERDLGLGLTKKHINKVFKGLISKPVYMEVNNFTENNFKTFSQQVYLSLTFGTEYREFTVNEGVIFCQDKDGKMYTYPKLFEQMKSFENGVYFGELTVNGIQNKEEQKMLINSKRPPNKDIMLHLFDYLSLEEYATASKKDKDNPCQTLYSDRLSKINSQLYKNDPAQHDMPEPDMPELDMLIESNILLMENMFTFIDFSKSIDENEDIKNCKEAWSVLNYEDLILRDAGGVFKTGKTKNQIYLKDVFDEEEKESE
jgi:hypothetical protein